ncbi:hypothetical protein M569_00531 [Genlisea aurea]|uniref:Smr domain-containing protein n=1 Tax=Genlisea aurea TaxID=192259 RepID=S8D492_9LAMI|nr:hypothetical protein M569_00531 [Genlisea aurea]
MLFDLEQRRKKQGLEFDSSLEDYPALSENDTLFNKRRWEANKPFSWVVRDTLNSGWFIDSEEREEEKPERVTSSISDPYTGLVQDVSVVSVNGDVDEAIRLVTEHNQSEREAPSPIVEPESDLEDDVYLLHRKEAIAMTRSASRCSKASNEAYLRGDHIGARLSSIKAREQWNAARKLNSKAANEILKLRNSGNEIWRLDLHGLHADEAIVALRERLQALESSSLSPRRRQPRLLQVITGKGNHSQGPAALPSAVRSFLHENGYHFDEKPGVMVVRPKFRQR